jgi:pilus assembly protein TadC
VAAEADPYTKLALSIFGGLVDANVTVFSQTKEDMRRAGIRMTVDEYVSTALLTSVITPMMTSPMAFILCIALGLSFPIVILVTVLVAMTTASLTLSALYFYPSMKSDSMRKSIQNALPFAAIYLSTLAGTGMTTDAVFKILADFPEYRRRRRG